MGALNTKIMAMLGARKAQWRLTARVTIAGLAGFTLIQFVPLPQGYWTMLTAVLVVQSSVGGSLKAAIDRVIGTMSGAFYGAFVASIMPHFGHWLDGPWLTGATLAVGLVPTAFLASVNPGFKIAPVTVIIVLFSATTMQIGLLHYALDRVGEIALGSILGLAISMVVLPARAHTLVNEAAARVLDLFAALAASVLEGDRNSVDHAAIRQRLNDIRAALGKLDDVADEARRERAGYLTSYPDPEPLVRVIRRVQHDLVTINRATMVPLPDLAAAHLNAPLAALSQSIAVTLRAAGAGLRTKVNPALPVGWDEAFAEIGRAMDALKARDILSALSGDGAGQIFALAFSLDQLRRNLKELAERAGEAQINRSARQPDTKQETVSS